MKDLICKRLIAAFLVMLISVGLAAYAMADTSANVESTYSNGIVNVVGTGFSANRDYIVRIVDKANSSIVAMDQVKSDVSGNITANVTTGLVSSLSNCVVYINNQDGTLAGQDITVTNYASSSGSGGGGGGGGTTPTEDKPPVNTNGNKTSTNLSGTTDSSGKTTASLGAETAQSLIDSARGIETAGGKAIVSIDVGGSSSSGAAELGITKSNFQKIASQTNAALAITSGIANVTFDSKAVDAIAGSVGGDLKIDISKVDKKTLSSTTKALVGDRPVYDFSITAGSTKISDFGGGSASISIPYTMKTGEDPNAIVVYFIDTSGNLNNVRGAYNAATGTVSFVTSHFSTYMVGYNKVTFADVSSSVWYSEPVTFIAARGITTGVDNLHFAPDMQISRGQFIVMLLKAYGISPLSPSDGNFSDAGNTYYTGYLAAAKKLGITNGIGNNEYAPENQITRQDVFTLVYRTLDILNELPNGTTGKTIQSFSDASNVSAYAKTALNTLVGAGIINGSGGMLNPSSNCTRAEMAQAIYKLLSN